MSKFVVQLNAYVIPTNHEVYKCFPGKTYRFSGAVNEANAVFLDIRGLDKLDKNPNAWSAEQMLDTIQKDRWDRELERRARGLKPLGSEGTSQTDRRNLTFLKGLIFHAKKGDLVVVPAGGYMKEVAIGQFTTGPGELVPVEARDGGDTHTYMARPVKWIGAQEKRFFSADILDLLHSPAAFFVIPKKHREQIYRIAYENFVMDGNFVATFRTSKQKFTAEDSAVVSIWLNAFDVLRNTTDPQKLAAITSFYELGFKPLSDNAAAELTININSPGTYVLRSLTPFALSLMVLLSLGGCDAKAIIDKGVVVELKSVDGSSTKECELDVEAQVKSYADALGYQRLQQACDTAHRAKTSATLTTASHLKH